MKKREAAIVSAFTGKMIGKFSDLHKYIEEIMGRPVLSPELGSAKISGEIKEKSRADFCALHVSDERE